MLKLFLDACCISRLTDDQTHARIRSEAEAIEEVLVWVERGDAEWIASDALAEEVSRTPDVGRRLEAEALLRFASEFIQTGPALEARARILVSAGFGVYDALHLAVAESAGVDVLLTTDDRFVKRAAQGGGAPRVPVVNPVSWLKGRYP